MCKSLLAALRSAGLMTLAVAACPFFQAQAAVTELTMPAIFADEMVLQRDKPIVVWGKSVPGDTITVSFGGHSAQTTVAVEDWSVQLPAMPANATGQTLTVAGTQTTKTYDDVLVGEVWLAGGQSNMGWNIGQEIDDQTYDMIQAYDYGGRIRFYEQSVTDGVKTTRWTKAVPLVAVSKEYRWSVVALHFARHLYERYGVPVAIVQTATGGVSIQSYISDEAMDASGLPPHPDADTRENQSNGYNYDLYVRDLIRFSATGAMWVHGEANAAQYDVYDELLETLIGDWRANAGQDLTFLIAQLPGYAVFYDRLDYDGDRNWRYMREAVSKAVRDTSNAAEVVTIDTMFEWMNIHPTDKKPIGDRFGLAARALAYGEDVLHRSPSYKSHTVNGNTVTVEFNDAPNGLKVDGYFTKSVVNGFMLAGSDKRFFNATASIVNGNRIELTSPGVAAPVHVRYNFVQAPQSNLCSAEGLPVNPFRTDAFAGPGEPAGGENLLFLPDPTPPVPPGELQVSVVVSEDATVRSDQPDANLGWVDLSLRPGYSSYVKFNVASLPEGAVVRSVTLRMYDNQNQAQGNGSHSFDVYKVTEPWSEATVTFNTRPAHDPSAAYLLHRQKGHYRNGRAADFALDPALFASGNGEYSMVIVNTGASWVNAVTYFDSKDSADGQVQTAAGRSIAPTLFINYEVAGGSPYSLNVSNGTGGGSYAAGTVVPIAANAPPAGQTFAVWTGDTAGIADVNAASTTLTMPAANATVTATYTTPNLAVLPYQEHWEDFASGDSPVGYDGWDASTPAAAVVEAVSYSYPHARPPLDPAPDWMSQALRLAGRAGMVAHRLAPVPEAELIVWDAMVVLNPVTQERAREALSNADELKIGFFANPDGHVTLWHRDPIEDTNRFTVVTGGYEALSAGEWARVTVAFDFSSDPEGVRFFRFGLHGVFLAHPLGLTEPNRQAGQPGGTWFLCANQEAGISTVEFNGSSQLDDYRITVETPGLRPRGTVLLIR